MSAPTPYLKYSWLSLHGERAYIEGGDIALARVHDVSVSMGRHGELRVVATGTMLKKDGTPGRHSRCSTADLSAPQPDWLVEIIEDARPRLAIGGAS